MKSLNQMKAFLLIGVFALSMMSFSALLSDWSVPAEYKTKKNPYAGKADDGTGQKLYNLHCKSCHGAKGLNDGPKAKNIRLVVN
jgi:mono/diheme cytochrome c family protein